MPGDEQLLDPELRAAIAGQPLETTAYLRHRLDPSLLTSQKSGNMPALADATDYVLTGGAASGSRARILAWLAAQQARWMGNEEASTIYGGLWLESIAGIHRAATQRADAEVAAATLAWGAFQFQLLLLGECPDGTVLQAGMRSGGHSPGTAEAWAEWQLALVRDDPQEMARAMAKSRSVHAGIGVSPLAGTLRLCKSSLQAMYQAAATAPGAPDYGLAQPIHVLTWRGDAGTGGAVVARLLYMQGHDGANGNGNTPPLMASFWQAGTVSYLPANGGAHFRQQLDVVTMTLAPGLLTYQSSKQGVQTIALPAGDPAEHRVIGIPGTAPPQPPPNPPDPPSPPSPPEDDSSRTPLVPETPVRTRADIAADILALQVQSALRGKRKEIAGEVDGSIPPWRAWPAVAADLATLGPQPEVKALAAEVAKLG